MLERIHNYYRNRGIVNTLKQSIFFIMSLFPRIIPIKCYSIYTGVKVHTESFRWDPTYKIKNVKAVRSVVSPGDKVIIIGSGFGVTSVHAAYKTGQSGSVVAFEASGSQFQRTVFATIVNGVYDRCEVNNSIVSHTIDTRGSTDTADVIKPSSLPPCDVIEMDCEGAEVEILSELQNPPPKLVVETHPSQYEQEIDIREVISGNGYKIIDEWDDPRRGKIIYASQN